MDLPNVNPGDIIKAADINKISSSVQQLETLILNQDTVTVTDNDTYLTVTFNEPG